MSTYYDVKLWRSRAKEARSLVDQSKDAINSSLMLRVAQTYEEMATKAEAVLNTRIRPRRKNLAL